MFSFKKHVQGFLNTPSLKGLIPSITDFNIEKLTETEDFEFPMTTRLGKRVEFIVKKLLIANRLIELLGFNIQLKNQTRTIGEIDYLIKHNKQYIHLELAFKFYLLDENLSSNFSYQWIGPNRKDYLHLKLQKLKKNQFKITDSDEFKNYLINNDLKNEFNPALLFKAQLFIPFNYNEKLPKNYENCICGEWLTVENFIKFPDSYLFFTPEKKDWIIEPKENNTWKKMEETIKEITDFHSRKFSPMVWIKNENIFKKCFVVWW